MSKFRKKRGKSTPAISTASLPDIIFILLFFFMVVTVMKDAELKVKVVVPEATELTKLEKKSLVSYFYIGEPKTPYDKELGSTPRLQLNDQFAKISDIPLFLEQQITQVAEVDRPLMFASLRGDKNITMGIVQDVKTELRKNGQLKVNYSATMRD